MREPSPSRARPARVVFASRIYAPEISAASGVLSTWAEQFRDRGVEVRVVTSRPPRGAAVDDAPGIDLRRAPVIRDRQNYVRGYLSYLSFDIPLAFRLLLSRRADLYVAEPPPTTVAVVRVVAALRRSRYVVRAADYWTEAAEMVTRSRWVLASLRRVERWGLNGAASLYVAHRPLLDRLREVGITARAVLVGFGADTRRFGYAPQPHDGAPRFVYAGTFSEWHGAGVFIEALALVRDEHPGARLDFYGNGEERDELAERAAALGVADGVALHGPVPPEQLSRILAEATASVASVLPVPRNDYAFATKVYSSLASGCPVIFAGSGPTSGFLDDAPRGAGETLDYDVASVARAMSRAADAPPSPAERRALSEWTSREHSLASIARRLVDDCLGIINRS